MNTSQTGKLFEPLLLGLFGLLVLNTTPYVSQSNQIWIATVGLGAAVAAALVIGMVVKEMLRKPFDRS